MATITKRGNRWSAQVRRIGFPALSKTFGTKSEAQAWGRVKEAQIDRQEPINDPRRLRPLTLGGLLQRYLLEITPLKRSEETERLRVRKLLRDPLCNLSLADLTKQAFASYRDRRLSVVKPGTVRREICILNHAIETARNEWDIGLATNPIKGLRLPALHNARDRRLAAKERIQLDDALKRTRNPWVKPIVYVALETALRRAEILNLRWEQIDLEKGIAHVPWSKTGASRTIPLTQVAVSLIGGLPCLDRRGTVFPISVQALRLAWERVRIRAGIPDLRFHDLRHEAITRFFELGLSLPEVALISGHRDPRMLLRYTHLRPEALTEKLNRLTMAA